MNKRLRVFIFGIVFGLLGLSQAGAAISVLVGTPKELAGNGSIKPPPPAGALSGDILVAQIVTKYAATVTKPSTDWVEVVKASASYQITSAPGNGLEQHIYYLNLSSAPASSYTWTIAGNNSGSTSYSTAAVIYSVRGAQPADCGAADTINCGGRFQTGNGTSITAPGAEKSFYAGSLRMAFFAENDYSAIITPAQENGASLGGSLRTGTGSSSNGVGLLGTYYLLNSESTGGEQTATLSSGVGSISSTFILAAAPTCLSDNFNRTTGLGSDWATTRVNGSFTPAIVSNRLRLTDTGTQESTAASFQRLLPGLGNYFQLSFKYYGYGGSGADGIAVILSDANVTPQPGGFGGSLGYAPKAASSSPGFSGGWLGLGLDEFGNFSNKTDSGACAPGVGSCATAAVPQSVSIRGSSPNYYWLQGSAHPLNPTVSNSTNATHLYRITVDSRVSGQAMVSVERDTTGAGTSYTTLIPSFNAATASGQAAIPANYILSLTGSTGDSTNTHEIDDLQICALRMNPMVTIDHYEFAVNTTPLTCTPTSVTVRACMDVACTTTYSGNVSATLLPTGGWVGGDTKTFPGSGASFSLSETVAGVYALGIANNSSIPPLKAFTQNSALCSINGSAYTSNCDLTFSDAGLLYTVPTLTSGKASVPITITAAKTDDATKTCVPAFTGSRSIKFWSGYLDPASPVGSPKLTLSAITPASTTALSTSSGTPSTVPLTFDANGQTTFTVIYPDAGQLSLNARYDGSVATSDNGLIMFGNSTFVAVPYKLCVDSPDTGWNCTNSNPQIPGNCSIYRKAGEAFNLRVTGKAYTTGDICAATTATTPNYKQSGIVLTSNVIAPAGGRNGTLLPATLDITANGTATQTNQTQSEAGVFTFTALPNNQYLGVAPPTGTSLNFGRFRPAYFTTAITPACGPVGSQFSYSGQPFAATITATNLLGGTTTNYSQGYALQTTLSDAGVTTYLTNNVLANNAFGHIPPALVPPLGVASPANVTYSFPSPGNATITLRAVDSDGTSSIGHTEGTSLVQSGRVRLLNAYGSELLNLPVKMTTENWNGKTWVVNAADTCTTATLAFAQVVGTPDITAQTCVLDTGSPGKSGKGCVPAAVLAQQFIRPSDVGFSGDFKLTLQKPGTAGSIDITATVPDWMKYPWASGAKTDPKSRATFGKRGSSPIIYLREIY